MATTPRRIGRSDPITRRHGIGTGAVFVESAMSAPCCSRARTRSICSVQTDLADSIPSGAQASKVRGTARHWKGGYLPLSLCRSSFFLRIESFFFPLSFFLSTMELTSFPVRNATRVTRGLADEAR